VSIDVILVIAIDIGGRAKSLGGLHPAPSPGRISHAQRSTATTKLQIRGRHELEKQLTRLAG